MPKTAMLTVRLEPEIKSEAEDILERLGIPASNAIKMFYQQIIFHRGLPFAVSLPSRRPRDIADMTAEELDAEMERGHADVLAGRVRPAEDVLADLRKRVRT